MKRKLKKEIIFILDQNNWKRHNSNAVASQSTQKKRKSVVFRFFRTLADVLGYDLVKLKNLGNRHLKKVFQYWEEKGSKSLSCDISIMKVFCTWIGKGDMVHSPDWYVQNPDSIKRKTATTTDKTWTGNGVDVVKKIFEISRADKRIGVILELQYELGLRLTEALLFRPHMNDKGCYVEIKYGTKGGRERVNPVDNKEIREVLERAKLFAKRPTDSMVPRGTSLKTYKAHYYYVIRNHGISRNEEGVTSHGLRHERCNIEFEELTGFKSTIQGGVHDDLEVQLERSVRTDIAERRGHSRPSISSAYIGCVQPRKKKKNEEDKNEMDNKQEASDISEEDTETETE